MISTGLDNSNKIHPCMPEKKGGWVEEGRVWREGGARGVGGMEAGHTQ